MDPCSMSDWKRFTHSQKHLEDDKDFYPHFKVGNMKNQDKKERRSIPFDILLISLSFRWKNSDSDELISLFV